MRKKPNAQNSELNVTAPSATAPTKAGSSSRPMTAVSTRPTSGTDKLDTMIGSASANTRLKVIALATSEACA